MCNLYSMTKPQDALRGLFKVNRDLTGNLPPLPGIFPDQMAPVVHADGNGGRTLEMMRWGFPPPPGGAGQPVTNIRNVASAYWRPWLTPRWRCLVPASSFCEYTDSAPKLPHWFGLDGDRSVFAFAGLWRPWSGLRKGETKEHRLFAFLTTEPNALVRPIHARAMPVILGEAEWDRWLAAETEDALALQRPLDPERLMIVSRGSKFDQPT
jgi:putative SOS response-associated peptidase YedK